ncbi:hypothetical protein CLV51_104374 [Chitinophaga niastensis]|uniref:Uncharacterized protein n=1 Tax=Chitinophaga niastensis TaxID=536980 RepID=A0A2P8HHI7_CHINA|nr:hypothetical protein [Chitinophaga niastensis]PSL45667.1 hypothetical protein CLV51_104374 [Chitinophaga niastensis]
MHFFKSFQLYKRIILAVAIIAILAAQSAIAQTDTIDPQHHKLNTKLLNPGVRQYIVYFVRPGFEKMLWLNLWIRQIEKATQNKEDVFKISQYWYSEDSTRYHHITSINSAADFSPIYHAAYVGSDLKAYNWSATGIKGTAIADNKAADYKLDFASPNYNWNLDIETFEMLPLAEGKSFVIQFYDAGLEPPAYVTYKVTGAESISTLDNKKVDCWKLFTEGNSPKGGHYTQIFWISKTGHELLKEEDHFGGMLRYKVKLPGFASFVPDKFAKQ